VSDEEAPDDSDPVIDDTDPDTEVRTWREDGGFRRERVHHLTAEEFADARDRTDGDDGLEWGVGALIESDGRVLLVREDGRWLLPGGEVEAGESHAEALVRELREETGLGVEPGERLAVVRNVLRHDGAEREFRFAIHRATAETTRVTDEPGLADEEIEVVRWVDDIPADTLDRDLLLELLGDGWC
jgi:8-oxo-dGTP pyrophosphatase MutT (NUDIX family)